MHFCQRCDDILFDSMGLLRPPFFLLRVFHSRRKSIPNRWDYQTLRTLFHIRRRCRCCIWQVSLLLVPYVFLVGQLLLGREESWRSIVQLSVVVFFFFFLAVLHCWSKKRSISPVLGNPGNGRSGMEFHAVVDVMEAASKKCWSAAGLCKLLATLSRRGCSCGLSIGSILVGSQQVGPECSSSTASMRQPPNQDKVACPRLESSMRDITLLSKTWLIIMYKTIEPCNLTLFWHICPDHSNPFWYSD